MKTFVRAGIAGLLLAMPGLSLASTVNFESAGSQCTLLFDPHGSAPSQLPSTCYYRSYNCRIGDKPIPVIILPPPGNHDTLPVYTPPKNNGPTVLPPGNNDPVGPVGPITCNAVPAPASAEFAGVGLAAFAGWSFLRKRRLARA